MVRGPTRPRHHECTGPTGATDHPPPHGPYSLRKVETHGTGRTVDDKGRKHWKLLCEKRRPGVKEVKVTPDTRFIVRIKIFVFDQYLTCLDRPDGTVPA